MAARTVTLVAALSLVRRDYMGTISMITEHNHCPAYMNLWKVARGIGGDELADTRCRNILSAFVGTLGALKQGYPERLRVILELTGRRVSRDFLQRLKCE